MYDLNCPHSHGLRCVPRNSYVGVLTPTTSGDFIWRQGLCKCHRVKWGHRGDPNANIHADTAALASLPFSTLLRVQNSQKYFPTNADSKFQFFSHLSFQAHILK